MGTFITLYAVVVVISIIILCIYCDIENVRLTEKQKAFAFLSIAFWPIAAPLWFLFFVFVSIKTLFQKDPEKFLEEKVKDISIDELSLKKRLLEDNLRLEKELAKLKKN